MRIPAGTTPDGEAPYGPTLIVGLAAGRPDGPGTAGEGPRGPWNCR